MALKYSHTFSQLPRQALCPGSARMEDGLPSEKSPYADEGTKLHQAMHDGPKSPINRNITEEQARLIGLCRDLPSPIENRIVEAWFCADGLCEGKPDLVTVDESSAEIWDWKFGHGGIDPGTEWQLKGQILAVAEEFQVPRIKATAYAPRTKESLTVQVETEEQLKQMWDEIAAVVNASEIATAPLKPSAESCKYCKAISFCPAASKELVNVPPRNLASQLNASTLSRALDVRELFTPWSKAVHQAAKLFKGEIPGWRRATREGDRYITDASLAYHRLKDIVDPGDLLDLMKLPFGELQNLFVDTLKQKGVQKKDALEKFDSILEGVIDRGGPVVQFRKDKKNVERSNRAQPLVEAQDGACDTDDSRG